MASLNLGNQITIYRGDDYERVISLTDEDGVATDITDWVIKFTAKETATYSDDTDDTDAVISITISSHTDATGGLTTLTIPNAVTNTIEPEFYVYDIESTDDSSKVRTLLRGDLQILADVTRE